MFMELEVGSSYSKGKAHDVLDLEFPFCPYSGYPFPVQRLIEIPVYKNKG
jgi:hypothetical protein